MKTRIFLQFVLSAILLAPSGHAEDLELPRTGLILDLDASKGVTLEEGEKVSTWRNQAPGDSARDFVKRDEGREVPGSGRPTLRKDIASLNGKPALVFRQQELVCMDEDTFDGLITGNGHTWITVVRLHDQRVGLKDVNAIFGNLRNGGKCEGVWGCLKDDNTLWWGTRNGITFGRFDANNPQVLGPKLDTDNFHLIAGRMGAGRKTAKLELFVDTSEPVASADFPVNPEANSSRMVIGQERDAIQHPGKESFDGEIARLLIWERPLDDVELDQALRHLRKTFSPIRDPRR